MSVFPHVGKLVPIIMVLLIGRGLWAEQIEANDIESSKVPGVVIDYCPADSRCWIGSPSLAVLPNGNFVASHDFFGPTANHKKSPTTVVFSSKNQGKTWRKVAEIKSLFWGGLFVYEGGLYIIGTRHEYGDVLIRRSQDGGRTWSEPTGSETGVLRQGRYHCAPCPVVIHKGRLWRSFEECGVEKTRDFQAFVMSAPVEADLLKAENWTFSESLPPEKNFTWLEGNLVVDPQRELVNILRTNDGGDDKAAIIKVDDAGRKLTYDARNDFIDMPGGGAKFTIRYDKKTARYWAIVNRQTDPKAYRNNLVLISSADLRNWKVETPLLYHPDAIKHGWQYIDWQFEGDDIIFVSRTAFDDGVGGAHRAHDANYLTFHRIADFRTREAGLLEGG